VVLAAQLYEIKHDYPILKHAVHPAFMPFEHGVFFAGVWESPPGSSSIGEDFEAISLGKCRGCWSFVMRFSFGR
jgi:hypothetical protein